MKKGYMIKLIKDLWIALRPLSLTLALASTTLGMLMANREGLLFTSNRTLDIFKIVLVTIGGMSILGCANLINDFYEGSFKYHRPGEKTYKFLKYERTAFDLLVFAFSMVCIGITALIGVILMYISTTKLIYVGIAGIIGAYAYTGEPFVYKKRGLGAILSLILVGSLMVLGSYMVFAGEFSFEPVLYTLPAGLMIPLMMMSNEIRDYERDKDLGIKTLTVILGVKAGKMIYLALIVAAYLLTVIFVFIGKLPPLALAVFLTLPIAIKSYKKVSIPKTSAIRITNWLHISFNLITIIALMVS
ncbi:prenyltransferase [Clostridium polynesiense]|uniref:prenyltransferase n=1 Tax=Clostridium polynesiense TaxID=1325933 RepID=UPI00058F3920|nr:prenyltransferase [Clostridium polynesiense]